MATLADATLPTRFEEFRFEIPEPLEATSNPWTVRPVRVPTDVILDCAASVTLMATLADATLPTRFEEFIFEIPEPFPVIRLATIEFRFEIPETFRVVNVPTDVILGWAGLVTLEATLAASTFPTKFEELRFERPEPFPM